MTSVMIMTMTLSEFIDDYAHKPWDWRTVNCVLMISDWAKNCCGLDPAIDFRNKYKTKTQWYNLIDSYGGIVEFCERVAKTCGLVEIWQPMLGDIGLIRGKKATVGAIALAPGLWLTRRREGMIAVAEPRVSQVVAWSVPQ